MSSPTLLSCQGLPCSQLSPAAPRGGRAPSSLPSRLLPATSTHPTSSGWDWWIQAGGTRRCPAQEPRPQESRTSRVLQEEPLGSAWSRCRVSGRAGQLLTAADGLGPAPDPAVLALPLCRPRQHQIRGASVVDLVPKAKSGPRPHRAHGDAWVGAVAGCEGAEGDGVSRDPPAWPLALLTALSLPRPAPGPRASCGPGLPWVWMGPSGGPDVPAQRPPSPTRDSGCIHSRSRAGASREAHPQGDTVLPKPRESAPKRRAAPSGGITGCGGMPAPAQGPLIPPQTTRSRETRARTSGTRTFAELHSWPPPGRDPRPSCRIRRDLSQAGARGSTAAKSRPRCTELRTPRRCWIRAARCTEQPMAPPPG